MLENFWYLMNTVRTEILEKFIIPGIGISYWKFLIYLAVAGVVITVLVNAVRYTSSESVSHDPSVPNYKPSKIRGRNLVLVFGRVAVVSRLQRLG